MGNDSPALAGPGGQTNDSIPLAKLDCSSGRGITGRQDKYYTEKEIKLLSLRCTILELPLI